MQVEEVETEGRPAAAGAPARPLVSLQLPGVRDAIFEALERALVAGGSGGEFFVSGDRRQVVLQWLAVRGLGARYVHAAGNPEYTLAAGADYVGVFGNPLWRAIDTYRSLRKRQRCEAGRAIAERDLGCAAFFEDAVSRPHRDRQARFLAGKRFRGDAAALRDAAWAVLRERFVWTGLEGSLGEAEATALRQVFVDRGIGIGEVGFPEQRCPAEPELSEAEAERVLAANAVDRWLWEKLQAGEAARAV